MPNVQLDENGLPLGLQALIDDSIKGLMRSIGDAGAAPSNVAGGTLLYRIEQARERLYYQWELLGGWQWAETFTTTALAANATYTGPTKDVYSGRLRFMGCIAFADQASATDGFKIQLSSDATNWDYTGAKATVAASVGASLAQELTVRYVHVVFINGAVAQTVFRLGGRYYG